MPNEDYKKFLGTHPKMTVKNAKIYWEVENIDKRIGEMIKQLEKWGIADETLFIFIGSDNGASGGQEIHNAGMKGHKGQPYQGGTRVPAFFRWPGGGIKGGSESAALISQMDIMPTLLDMCEVPVPPSVEGLSMVGDRTRDHLYGEFGENSTATRMVVDGRHKLIYYAVGNRTQLFDLVDDPNEMRDVADDSDHAKVLDELIELLKDQLYGTDLEWLDHGELAGVPDLELTPRPKPDRGMGNQRGWRFM